MQFLAKTAACLLLSVANPVFSQEAAPVAPSAETPAAEPATTDAQTADPSGKFVDEFGSSFEFSLCGESGTDLCALLTNLEGESATEENMAFVGKQVMQAAQTAPNQWKGSLAAGGMSAEATITQTGPDTIEIQGCRAAVLCQTLVYNRAP
jgi:hypothetical protein